MSKNEDLLFLSPAWFAFFEASLRQLVAERKEALRGVTFSICETFLDAPPDNARLTWSARIEDGEVDFSREQRPSQCEVTASYKAVLPLASFVYARESEAANAAMAAYREAALARGDWRVKGDYNLAAPVIRTLLRDLHDIVAARCVKP